MLFDDEDDDDDVLEFVCGMVVCCEWLCVCVDVDGVRVVCVREMVVCMLLMGSDVSLLVGSW